ncbi:hypothetical protein [Vibrio lentus]|uniref:Uncharacterized protein n=1 Tax=Vibrio lentus TaxID=136468 RepID=A0A2N7BHZ5_9VIBR|nr:hypothetical protein [Vibrio lentus]PME46134.1 hypothetical protein BCV34_19010 [Vibrio lentus]PME55438.1 hypothetical protein BCV30_20420 [Vibrio lentus]PME86178.1 hypothetical protein BCV27_07155 [Vibrio lentus]PMG69082.1 hypothetical protein BCU86_09425 [Vibrio lentus]PMH93364.1 hypothetical protein BCU56_22520 [Vibrio lentus]
MIKRFVLLLSLSSSLVFACGLHQETGFSLVTEPGSLEVFGNIIHARQDDEFGNLDKPDHFKLFAIKSALAKAHPSKIEFNLFEAIKGHYSQISIEKGVNVSGRDTLPTESDLLLITELDVFDALANGTISWDQATLNGLVVINGPQDKREQLEDWFSDIFEGL